MKPFGAEIWVFGRPGAKGLVPLSSRRRQEGDNSAADVYNLSWRKTLPQIPSPYKLDRHKRKPISHPRAVPGNWRVEQHRKPSCLRIATGNREPFRIEKVQALLVPSRWRGEWVNWFYQNTFISWASIFSAVIEFPFPSKHQPQSSPEGRKNSSNMPLNEGGWLHGGNVFARSLVSEEHKPWKKTHQSCRGGGGGGGGGEVMIATAAM